RRGHQCPGSRADRRGAAGDPPVGVRGHDHAHRHPRDAVRRRRGRPRDLHGRRHDRGGGPAPRHVHRPHPGAHPLVPARGAGAMTDFLDFWRILLAKLPEFLPYLLRGALVTLEITVATLVFACVLGLVLALVQRARLPLVGSVAAVYVELLRAVPVLTTLFIIYFG